MSDDNLARHDDPDTSQISGELTRQGQERIHCALLLLAYDESDEALADVEAIENAGLSDRKSPWRRCTTLRKRGYIKRVGQAWNHETRRPVMLCSITELGRMVARNVRNGSTRMNFTDPKPTRDGDE